jgi:hypothetical protein
MVNNSHTKSFKMEKQFNSTQKDITAVLGELQALYKQRNDQNLEKQGKLKSIQEDIDK